MLRFGVCRSMLLVVTLTAGRCWADPVTLHVVDGGGKPIAGATVARLIGGGFYKPRFLLQGTTQSIIGLTNENGLLRFDCDPAQRSAFLVSAPNDAPRTFGFWGCVPPDYRLTLVQSNATFSGRILDAAGKAVANADVRIRLGNFRLLEPAVVFSRDYPQFTYDFSSRTNQAGRFIMPAPLEGDLTSVDVRQGDGWHSTLFVRDDSDLTLDALRDGSYSERIDSEVTAPAVAKNAPRVVRTVAIHLRVVDADTNLPVANIHVIPGGCLAPDQPKRTLWQYALDLPGNQVTWSFYDNAWGYFLRVEADGYAAAPTRLVKASEKDADVEVRLKKAQPIVVKVQTPSGLPAAGAKVYLASPTIMLNVPMLEPRWDDLAPIAVADEDGVFRLVPPDETYRLAIEQADGTAEVAGSDLTGEPLVLQPWAKVSVRLGSKEHPIGRTFIEPQSYGKEDCWILFGSSNADGLATFDHFPAGRMRLTVNGPASAGWSYLDVDRKVVPGQHLNLSILTGATTMQASLPEFPGCKWTMLWIRPAGPAANLPADVNRLIGQAQGDAVETAQRAAADRRAREDVIGEIQLPVPKDGHVSVAGLRPGTYEIGGYVSPPPYQQATYTLRWFFSIPALAPAVVDLGTVSPAPAVSGSLQVGQITPELGGTSLDGKPFSLKDQLGRWVLLDFWGTWCGFCIAEEPTLKDAYEGWVADGRLVMVSASVDDTVEQVRRHVAENKLPWTQLVLGPRGGTNVPQRFGVDGYPTIMLISPDGELIETGLRGSGLRYALIKHVGPPSPPAEH